MWEPVLRALNQDCGRPSSGLHGQSPANTNVWIHFSIHLGLPAHSGAARWPPSTRSPDPVPHTSGSVDKPWGPHSSRRPSSTPAQTACLSTFPSEGPGPPCTLGAFEQFNPPRDTLGSEPTQAVPLGSQQVMKGTHRSLPEHLPGAGHSTVHRSYNSGQNALARSSETSGEKGQ